MALISPDRFNKEDIFSRWGGYIKLFIFVIFSHNKRVFVNSSIFLVLLLVICSCSTNIKNPPPEREIDKGYTLPDKTDAWGTIGLLYYKDNNNKLSIPVPVPLYWEYSIGESVTLESPLSIPVGVRVSAYRTPKIEIGGKISLLSLESCINCSNGGLEITYFGEVYFKNKITENFALIINPVFYKLTQNHTAKEYWLEGIFQLSEKSSFMLKVGIENTTRKNYDNHPLGFEYSYRINSLWDSKIKYNQNYWAGNNKAEYLYYVFTRYF